MRTCLTAAALALAPLLMAVPARAQLTATSGSVLNVYADPSDFVLYLDKPGRCGSQYFHIQRAKTNFKEMVSIIIAAFTTGKTFTAFVEGCAGDRNLMSHGYLSR